MTFQSGADLQILMGFGREHYKSYIKSPRALIYSGALYVQYSILTYSCQVNICKAYGSETEHYATTAMLLSCNLLTVSSIELKSC